MLKIFILFYSLDLRVSQQSTYTFYLVSIFGIYGPKGELHLVYTLEQLELACVLLRTGINELNNDIIADIPNDEVFFNAEI